MLHDIKEDTMTEAKDTDKLLRLAYFELFKDAAKSYNAGDYLKAEKQFRLAGDIAEYLSDNKIERDARINQAYALMNGGSEFEAIEQFERAIACGDTHPHTYIFLSNLYMTHDRVADAVSLLETASSAYPDNSDVEAQLINAYTMSGQLDRAMSKYEEAVKADPDNKVYQYNYGSLLLQAEQYSKAIEHLKRAVELDPTYANAQYNLGAAYVNKAVSVNDQINAIDDEVRANSLYTEAQKKAKQDELSRLTELRGELFEKAIVPLEKAKDLFEEQGHQTTDLCRVLIQSYVQTGQDDKAEAISDCASYADMK